MPFRLTAAALLATTLLFGPAAAQQPPTLPSAEDPLTPQPSPPAVSAPEETGAIDPAPMDGEATSPSFAAAEAWLGLPVVSADGVEIGTVEDVEVDTNGEPIAVMTEVGGFLGFGATPVRLAVGAANFDGKEVRIGLVETDVEALASGDPDSAVGIATD